MVRLWWLSLAFTCAHAAYRDRRKLTFYFVAEKRIDFRELVRELFRYVLSGTAKLRVLISLSTVCIKPESGWPPLVGRQASSSSLRGTYFFNSLSSNWTVSARPPNSLYWYTLLLPTCLPAVQAGPSPLW